MRNEMMNESTRGNREPSATSNESQLRSSSPDAYLQVSTCEIPGNPVREPIPEEVAASPLWQLAMSRATLRLM